MKRIFVLALALIVAVGSLAPNIHATESTTHSSINMLQAVTYDFYRNGNFIKTVNGAPGDVWCSGDTSAAWVWKSSHSVKYDSMVVTIAARTQPASVMYYDAGGNNRTGTLLGKTSAGAMTYFQYKFGSSTSSEYFKFEATWSAAYTGEYLIVSAFGNVADTVSLNTVSYFANAVLYDNGGADDGMAVPSDSDFRWPLSVGSGSNVSLPVVVDFTGPTGSDFYTIDYGEVFLKVPFTSTLKYFDSVSFVIYTCGQIRSIGSRIENSDGSVIDGLTTTFEYCGETQMLFTLEEQYFRMHCYVVTVDIKGYDLTDRVLTLQIDIPSVFGSWIYQYDRGFYFQCSSIVGKYDINEVPWYTQFAMWLDKILTMNQASFLSTLTSYFDQLLNVFNASGNNDQFQDDVGQQGDKLDDMQDVMDSVTLPALDSVNVDPGSFVNQSDVQLLVSPIAVIYAVPTFKTILLMSIMMATAGYVLFGKR